MSIILKMILKVTLFLLLSPLSLLLAQTPGTFDPTFSGDGIDIRNTGDYEQIFDLARQDDGKIVGVGTALAGFLVVRYLPGGNLDPEFGDGNGYVKTTINGTTYPAKAFAVAIQTDGKIVVAGECIFENTRWGMALARYHPNGTLDRSFDGDGIIAMEVQNLAAANISTYTEGRLFDVAVDNASGKIIAVGYARQGFYAHIAILRFNADGRLDTTFDGDGIVVTPVGTGESVANGVELLDAGKILVVGRSRGSDKDWTLVRYNGDGSLDTSFGNRVGDNRSGITSVNFGVGDDVGQDLTLLQDGKVLVAGFAAIPRSGGGIHQAFGLARFNANGTLDAGFHGDGMSTYKVGDAGAVESAISMGIQWDGKIVTVGHAKVISVKRMVAIRFDADGNLDTIFGGGPVVVSAGEWGDGYGLVIQPDGKIILGGETYSGYFPGSDMTLARLFGNPPPCGNGVLDTGEECDDGNYSNGDGCSDLCVQEVCGDGRVQTGLGEECDDGNTKAGDGCNATCRREVCGDGILHAAIGEECDDGNTTAGDGCSPTCTTEFCGDGTCVGAETCDTCSGDCGACPPEADLVVQKRIVYPSPNQIRVFQPLDFEIHVVNNGPDPADGVVLTDSIRTGLRFDSLLKYTGQCQFQRTDREGFAGIVDDSIICNFGTLQPGGFGAVRFRVRPQSRGDWLNGAEAESSSIELNPADNSSVVEFQVR